MHYTLPQMSQSHLNKKCRQKKQNVVYQHCARDQQANKLSQWLSTSFSEYCYLCYKDALLVSNIKMRFKNIKEFQIPKSTLLIYLKKHEKNYTRITFKFHLKKNTYTFTISKTILSFVRILLFLTSCYLLYSKSQF